MKIEMPSTGLGEEKKDKRKRVDDLRKGDNPYQDSVYDVAAAEETHRELLRKAGIEDKEAVEQIADHHSDEVVQKKEAEHKKWKDELTGLRNKNAYLEEVPLLIDLGKRHEKNCSMLMIDFDHFKMVNDTYGHGAGDQALQQLAAIIAQSLQRSSDAVYRYGGEEFLVYLPDTDVQGAQMIAERIRENVEAAEVVVNDENGEEVILKKTVSIGCASLDQAGDIQGSDSAQVRDVIQGLADKAVYGAKEGGRNRVETYSEGDDAYDMAA